MKKYSFQELKPGLEIYRDRLEDVFSDSEYFYYIERLKIESNDGERIESLRSHIYVYGREMFSDIRIAQEFAGEAEEDRFDVDEKWWNDQWSNNIFYTKSEIQQKIMIENFERQI